ncbi:MAG: cell division protein FtsQ/DivIB [Bacteroidota bacterium]
MALKLKKLPFMGISLSRKVRLIMLVVLIALFSLLTYFATSWYNSRSVESIIISGNILIESNEINNLIEKDVFSKIRSSLDFIRLEKEIEKHPFVKTASISNKGISGIRIIIEEQTPEALVKTHGLELVYAAEGAGIMPYRVFDNLASIPVISNVYYGGKIDSAALESALGISSILKANPSLNNLISEIIYDRKSGEYGLLLNGSCIPVIIGTPGLSSSWNKKLEYCLPGKGITESSSSIEYIDLRWPDRIIVKEV